MLYYRNKTIGLTPGQNPLTHNLYTIDADEGSLNPPPSSEFRITDSNDNRITDNNNYRITD